jgi:hypothetical protein
MSLFTALVSSDNQSVPTECYVIGGVDSSDAAAWLHQQDASSSRTKVLLRLHTTQALSASYGVVTVSLFVTLVVSLLLASRDLAVNWGAAAFILPMLGVGVAQVAYVSRLVARDIAKAIRGSRQQYVMLGTPDSWERAPDSVGQLVQRIGQERLRAWLLGQEIDDEGFIGVKVTFDLLLVGQVDIDVAEEWITCAIKASDRRRREAREDAWVSAEAKALYIAAQEAERTRIIATY